MIGEYIFGAGQPAGFKLLRWLLDFFRSSTYSIPGAITGPSLARRAVILERTSLLSSPNFWGSRHIKNRRLFTVAVVFYTPIRHF